jgi:2-oxoglutarate ferredoxin oxidoreductase subunit alpha
MMETVEFPQNVTLPDPDRSYALTGCENRESRIVRTLWLDTEGVPTNNRLLQETYKKAAGEVLSEESQTQDAEIILVAYGLSARIARSAMLTLREKNVKVGLFRPITLWPFPGAALEALAKDKKRAFMVVEMSAGQFVEDVERHTGRALFYGTPGGDIPQEGEIVKRILEYKKANK